MATALQGGQLDGRAHGNRALACLSHRLTAKASDRPAMTSLRLLAVLNVLSSTPARAKRLAPRPDGPLTHFVSPRGEMRRLGRSTWRKGDGDGFGS